MELVDLILFAEIFAELDDSGREAVVWLQDRRLDRVSGFQCQQVVRFVEEVLWRVDISDAVEKELRDLAAYAELKV